MMRNRGVNDPTRRAGRRPAPHSGSFTPRFLVSISVTANWAQSLAIVRPVDSARSSGTLAEWK